MEQNYRAGTTCYEPVGIGHRIICARPPWFTLAAVSAPTVSPQTAPTRPSRPWYGRDRIGAWIESTRIQRAVIVVIVVNAVVLGIQTAPGLAPSTAEWLHWIDLTCLTIFIVEIALKLYAFGLKFFRSAWNVFDFVVVAVALVPGSGFAVLRALRVLRVLRLISMVPALRRVVEALVRAVPGILSIGALLFLLFYVAAVMATTLFGASFPEYFGTLGRSLYSLFQTMTMDNWSTLSREVLAEYNWAWAFFVPFILLSAFTVLNLFIAVMVDAMKFLNDGDQPQDAAPSAATEYAELLAEVRALRAELAAERGR